MRDKWFIVLIIGCIILAGCSAKVDKTVDEELEHIAQSDNVVEGHDTEEDVLAVPDAESDDEDDGEVSGEEEEEEINHWVANYGFEVGQTYEIYGKTLIHEFPETILSHTPVGQTKPGEKYIFTEIADDLVKVKTADVSGWVSPWYFTEEARAVSQVEPYEMIVLSPVQTSFYPGVEASDHSMELGSGKVVQIYKKYNDWVSVFALFGDAVNPIDMWLKESDLIPFEPDFAKEGVLKLGSKVLNESGRVKEESSGFPLWITGEQDDMFAFSSPGGRGGYILKEDFEPNPFVKPVLSMKFTVNYGMDADYLVEELTGDAVTTRYFDYQHHYEPDDETSTVAFDEMLEVQNGQPLYTIQLYLSYPTSEVVLKPTAELIDLIKTDAVFRGQLGRKLGKRIAVAHDLVLTADMIRKSE